MSSQTQAQEEEQVFLDVKQVAARYGISVPTVWAWLANDLIPQPIRFTPSCSRWSLDTLREFEASLNEQRAPRRLWDATHKKKRQSHRRRTR